MQVKSKNYLVINNKDLMRLSNLIKIYHVKHNKQMY